MVFSWGGGNSDVDSLHQFRRANQEGRLDLEEHCHGAMANAYVAGASGLPSALFKGYESTLYPEVNANFRFMSYPFSRERLTAVPAIKPDVGAIQAQRAVPKGNVRFDGIMGVQKECLLASKPSLANGGRVRGVFPILILPQNA
jgi:glutaconate CoA-transferase subunit A